MIDFQNSLWMTTLKDTFKTNTKSQKTGFVIYAKHKDFIKKYKLESEGIHLTGLFHHITHSLFGLHVFHLCDSASLPSCHFDPSFLPHIIWTSCVRLFLSFVPLCSVDAIHLDCYGWLEILTRTRTQSPKKKTHQIQEFPDSGGGLRLYSFQLLLQGCHSFLQESSMGHMKTFALKSNSCRKNLSREYLGHQFKPAHWMETDVCWEMRAEYNWVLITILWERYPENTGHVKQRQREKINKKTLTHKYGILAHSHSSKCM